MTEATCTPLSWLRLERHALGELDADEGRDISAHLSTCARCRAVADQIAADAGRALPPLPAVAASAATSRRLPPSDHSRPLLRGRRQAFVVAAAAAAFAVVVGLGLRPRDQPRVGQPRIVARVVAIKGGGDVAIELVRERDGSVAWDPTSFAAGDRFKLLVTCPPPLQLHADIVVLQSEGPAFPGEPTVIACGNCVPVLPAFRITGPGPATVCVAFDGSAPPARAALSGGDMTPTTARACLHLDHAE
jgi:hypothetical protein